MLQVFKFGGASVKDAAGVKNVCRIISRNNNNMVVVISAMGKTTNAMEDLVEAYFELDELAVKKLYDSIYEYHNQIVSELFEVDHSFNEKFDELFKSLWKRLQVHSSGDYDYEYDQIVSYGEMLSTQIVSNYANNISLLNEWVDVRDVIKTDENYRDAVINWGLSAQLGHKTFSFKNQSLYITQGFLGSTINNQTTTLGREGSDYSGAIIAHILEAEHLTIWKDVPGVLNADPRWYPSAQKLKEISYPEAIELAFYGAQVIHPKTLKPLQNKGIPLYVKSFIDESIEGTVIRSVEHQRTEVPVYILKKDQLFITISPKDFSFILEGNLRDIFSIFTEHKVKINLMQNSALNFSVCVNNIRQVNVLIDALKVNYTVRYNEDVELVTVRNYTTESIEEITSGKEIVDSQLSRNTARYVIKKSDWVFN
ncbi:aspartate kinase [Labilibacter sediminis]|nr:aspartate kinase [Labilibacter sediminis]